MFFDDKRRMDSILGPKMSTTTEELNEPKDGEEVEEPLHGLAKELHTAIMAGDHKGMAEALHAFLVEAHSSPGESVPD
jgi:hypothetical protein